MNSPRVRLGWLLVLATLFPLRGQCAEVALTPAPARVSASSLLPLLDELPEPMRLKARKVLDKPAMYARGRPETFRCQPEIYHWLLDHPDRAVKAWQRLGARCMNIAARGENSFGCKDNQGTDMVWSAIVSNPREQVWYAEGVVRPGFLLPVVGVKALFVVRIDECRDALGRAAVRHQGEVVLSCDSKAIGLATRLLGASAPGMAEEYIGQIQTFFAALAWYLNEHPERSARLLAE